MREQREIGIEIDEEILPVPSHARDPAAGEAAGERARDRFAQREPGEARGADHTADDARFQQAPHRFHLGELGHGGTLGGAPGAVKARATRAARAAPPKVPAAEVVADGFVRVASSPGHG